MAKHLNKMLLGSIFSALLPASALAGTGQYSVELNKTELLTLPGPASAIVIGNPKIADISIHSTNTIFVVGRGYGETNILVLDAAGQKMMDADIQVIQPISKQGVRLYNAKARQSYSCTPYCLPSPTLGDDNDYISSFANDTKPITSNTFATSSQQPASAPSEGYANSVRAKTGEAP